MLSPARVTRFQDACVALLEEIGRDYGHAVSARGNACRERLNLSFVLGNSRDPVEEGSWTHQVS